MNAPPQPRRLGITFRTALLSWLVTLATLGLFLVFIIPQQQRTFRENLESKARGITASLHEITAGAVVNEDFSSVVDHCQQVLKSDESIDFLVITKNDGFSIINDSGRVLTEAGERGDPQWRVETLGGGWHPSVRMIQSGIETVPLFNRRAFLYSRPFGYSGVEWGWIHVGLSVQSYDASIRRVSRQTLVLTLLCIGVSLAISVVYAKRLVGPILDLQTAVRRVARGEFSARAVVRSADEIGSLGESFNTMAEALLQRNRILESVRIAAKEFLSANDWHRVVGGVQARIGEASGASRVLILENRADVSGALRSHALHEWTAPDIGSQLDWAPYRQGICWSDAAMVKWAGKFQHGYIASLNVRELLPEEQAVFPPSVKSVIISPIMVRQQWWGILSLQQCDRERSWNEAEVDCFHAVSDMLGAAIDRQRAQHALVEAKEHLEVRVQERTWELLEQVEAEGRARRELAATQQRLMELSRQAGMAEVATGVLHNVGNVLNSVNVSATIVANRVQESRLERLASTVRLIEEHEADLAAFLRDDPKGQRVVPYLGKLVQHLAEEQATVIRELQSLTRNVEHIKGIVSVQQDFAKVSGVIEIVSLAALFEDAIQMNQLGLDRHGIRVVREFEDIPPVQGDKHKILQVLLNLIRNAKEAMKAGDDSGRVLSLRLLAHGPDRIRLQVQDTGVGLKPEHLTGIFSHGFTTKRDGHGFGLHMGALAAQEMGGSLTVRSDGPGRGAEFILELPRNPHVRAAFSASNTSAETIGTHANA